MLTPYGPDVPLRLLSDLGKFAGGSMTALLSLVSEVDVDVDVDVRTRSC
jgi:hypothetical protein